MAQNDANQGGIVKVGIEAAADGKLAANLEVPAKGLAKVVEYEVAGLAPGFHRRVTTNVLTCGFEEP